MNNIEKTTTNWNYAITKYFLNNNRLTILALALLVLLGAISTLFLKTTGFPNPEIKSVIVRTIYPGASAEKVAQDITIPLENTIKAIEGVDTYRSTSSNSFSVVSVTIKDAVDSNKVKSDITTQIQSVKLPDDAQKPTLLNIDIGGPDYIFSIVNPSLETTYNTFRTIKQKAQNLPETSTVTPENEIKKTLKININPTKLADKGLTISDIENAIKPLGESLPVVSDQTIDNTNVAITTTINDKSLDTIKNLSLKASNPKSSPIGQPGEASEFTQSPPESIELPQPTITSTLLSEVATVDIAHEYEKPPTTISYTRDGKGVTEQAFVFQIKTKEGTDQSAFTKKLETIFEDLDNVTYSPKGKFENVKTPTLIIENYTVNEANQRQVEEVISGLIGGKLGVENPLLSNFGWLLGGIQLVFLVMLAFVSWRAAIVSALAIPLSLIFSTIYLYFTGQSLNTLVLFSLVLVIGLVVDPALVILESIQRKIDIGLKGKHAALEAVKDVGDGLFLATLTNVIVFAPFGVISGVLGQIFRYIPLTIVPAVIGSYIVPLIFLAWFGGLFLKKNKNKTDIEEENVWGIAKWLITFNERILFGPRWIRLVIIIITLVISLGVTAILTSSRQVKVTQFSTSQNGQYLVLSGSFLPSVSKELKSTITREILTITAKNENVVQAFPLGQDGDLSYYIQLKESKDRKEISANIAKNIENEILPIAKDYTEELSMGVDSNGPPSGSYSVQVALTEQDPTVLKNASIEVGKILQTACYKDNKVTFASSCSDTEKVVEKVDDGYTNKSGKVLNILLDRTKLKDNNLSVGGLDSILVNQSVKSKFDVSNNNTPLTTLTIDKEELDVVIDKQTADMSTLSEIQNITIQNLLGQQVPLKDVGEVKTEESKAAISRIKGQSVTIVQAKLKDGFTDESVSAAVTDSIVKYYQENSNEKEKALNLSKGSISSYSEGGSAGFAKSFSELLIALVLAIILTYIVLAIFFNSLLLPLVVLYTIPLTLIGIMPGLAWFGGGQFGFLEIIGMIILIGVVENAAIFLIDAARQRIDQGMGEIKAISIASGLRLRPVLLTKFTAIASLTPLAFLSEIYRSISILIIFGLLASGFLSLITTPILFIFFRWVSRQFHDLMWYHKILFFPFFPIYVIYLGIKDKPGMYKNTTIISPQEEHHISL